MLHFCRKFSSSITTCGNATKGAAKRVKKSQGRRNSMHSQAIRSVARTMDKKSGICSMMEDAGAL